MQAWTVSSRPGQAHGQSIHGVSGEQRYFLGAGRGGIIDPATSMAGAGATVRLYLRRFTGAATPTNQTPEKTSTRTRTPDATSYVTNWGTSPTYVGFATVILGTWGALAANTMCRQATWRPPRKQATPHILDTEQAAIGTSSIIGNEFQFMTSFHAETIGGEEQRRPSRRSRHREGHVYARHSTQRFGAPDQLGPNREIHFRAWSARRRPLAANAALSGAGPMNLNLGLLAESAALLAAAATRDAALGLLTSTPSLLSITPTRSALLTELTEIDALLSPAAQRNALLGILLETDSLLNFSGVPVSIVLGLLSELDALQAASAVKAASLGLLFETDIVPPGSQLLDDFNRADESVLAGAWKSKFTTSLTNLQLVGNQIASGSAGYGDGVWNARTFAGDVEAYATVVDVSTDRGLMAHATLNASGQQSSYIWQWEPAGASGAGMYLKRFDNNTTVLLGYDSGTISAGDKIMLRVNGGNVEGWVFQSGVWSLRKSVADTTYRVGQIGLRARDTTPQFDDFGGKGASLLPSKSSTLGLLSQNNALQPAAAQKAAQLGLLGATSSLLPLAGTKSANLGLLAESDLLSALTLVRNFQLGLLSEADVLRQIAVVRTISIMLGLLTETDGLRSIRPPRGLFLTPSDATLLVLTEAVKRFP